MTARMPMIATARGASFNALARACAYTALVMFAATALGQSNAGAPPNFSGIWRAANAANWDLEPHAPEPGPVASLGALLVVPPGPGVVVDGPIPYLQTALAQRNENRRQRWTADPELKCFMPGVPRANYLPYPFQIVHGTDTIIMTYEFADAVRTVYMKDPGPAPANSWMGWNVGRWDGNTLVVDVTAQHDDTWLDRSGNYHSDEMHVVERYTLRSPDVLVYEATIEDPQVFARPWTIRMPLYRDISENARLMEFKCIPFVESALYDNVGR
jgi:hypothetical protein